MPRKLDEVFFDITARTSGFTRGIAAAKTSLGGFVGKIGGATVAIGAFGAAAVAAGIKATRMAAALDASLREVSTLLPGTVENVSRLREQVVALSTEVPQTPELLSQGLYQVISAGISDTADAMDVLRVSAEAAVAGLTDTFTSVDAITTVLNAFGLQASEAQRVSDVLFATVQAGKTTFGELSSNIGTVATSAALAGVSIEEVGAAMATLTKFTGNTARSATALDALLRSVTSATDEQRAAAEKLGVEYTVSAIQTKGLTGFLEELNRETGGTVEGLAKITTQAEAQRASFVLAGKGLADYKRTLTDTNDATGNTTTAFDKMSGSLENQRKLLQNKINAAWLNLGDKLLPTVISALETVNRLLESDAEALSRAFETLGLTQEAAAVIVAEQRRKIVESLQSTREDINREIAAIAEDASRLSAGVPTATEFDRPTAEALFPPELIGLQEQSARVQREILEATIQTARTRAGEPDVSKAQIRRLGEIVSERQKIIGQLDQQIRGEQDLLNLTTARGKAEADVEAPDTGAAAEPLTEAEQKALDLRDALLKADEALRQIGSSGADLFSEVPGILADVRRQIEETGEGLDVDFGAVNLETRVLQARRAIEAIDAAMGETVAQAKAVQAVLDTWGVTIDDFPPEIRETIRAMADATGEAEEVDQSVRDIINDISFAARGAVELADAFGLVGDEASQIVNQVALIGEGVGRIASGDVLGGVGGVLSGLAGIVGGLSGGGPTQAEIERDEAVRELTDRVRELTDRLDVIGEILRSLPGRVAAGLSDVLEFAQLAIDAALDEPDQLGRIQAGRGAGSAIAAELRDAGLSLTDLQEAAERFDLPIDQLLRLIEGVALSGPQLEEAFAQAESLFDLLDTGLAEVLDTVQGRLSLLRDSFDVLDIEDPAEQLRLLAGELDRVRQESEGFALSAAEIARLEAGDEEFIEQLFREIQSGSGRFTRIGAFGDLSFDEFFDILRQMESIQDRIAESVEGDEGDFQQVSAINRLTVEQGDTMLAQDATRNFYLEDIRDRMREGIPVVQVTDTMLAAAASVRHEHSGRIEVIVTGDAVDTEGAAVIRDGLVNALSLDRDLGEQLRRQRAGLGLPPTRTQ